MYILCKIEVDGVVEDNFLNTNIVNEVISFRQILLAHWSEAEFSNAIVVTTAYLVQGYFHWNCIKNQTFIQTFAYQPFTNE